MSAAAITPELVAQHQLTGPEYQKIVSILGREPTYTELGIFSVMWSEHCSYKSSRLHLKKLPTRGKVVLEGVVGGISHYGNCFGVPTVGGECIFEECYSSNPLVNVFALGVFRRDEIFYAKAAGVGNPVIYVGAKTGRDGIHGASMAS